MTKKQSDNVFQQTTWNNGLVIIFSLSKLSYLVDLFDNRLGFCDYRGNQNLEAFFSTSDTNPRFNLSPLYSHLFRTAPDTTTNNKERQMISTIMWARHEDLT
jgi:hypothetical protein